MEQNSQTGDVPGPVRREVVSFARRDGRLSHRHQQAWDAHHARYVIEPERSVRSTSVAPGWRFDAEQAFGRHAPLVVEIGSGDGDAVLASASARPDEDFVAIEVYRPGLARTIVGAERRSLDNLRVLAADAMEVLTHAMPQDSVYELRVFFPDPWPKARHHKRRLVDETFVAAAARVLEPGGRLRLATDWQDYADQMVRVCEASGEFDSAHPGSRWGHRGDRIETRFERKGLAVGRDIRDMTYVRRPARR